MWWIILSTALTAGCIGLIFRHSRRAPTDIELFGRPQEEIEAEIAGDTETLARIHAWRGRMTRLAPMLPGDNTLAAYALPVLNTAAEPDGEPDGEMPFAQVVEIEA